MNKIKYQSLENFFQKTKKDIDEVINLNDDISNFSEYLINGKYLRSVLSHLAFKVCTCGLESDEAYRLATEGAVAIELAHSASLIHDDIIDKDLERRGEPALYLKKGISKAFLIGHKMLLLGFNISMKHCDDLAKLYVDTWHEILNGEIKEVDYNGSENQVKIDIRMTDSLILQEYYEIMNMKTAALFSSACKAGAIEAGADKKIIDVLSDYSRAIGIAYQLADDLVDLKNGEFINSVIFPVLSKYDKELIKNDTSIELLKIKIFDNFLNIKESYIKEIQYQIELAKNIVNSTIIPQSQFKDLLIYLPEYIINKMLNQIHIRL